MPRKPATEPDEWVTAEEFADMLGVPRTRIYNWRYRGDPLPASFKFGRSIRFRRSAVDQWIRDHMETLAATSDR